MTLSMDCERDIFGFRFWWSSTSELKLTLSSSRSPAYSPGLSLMRGAASAL
jgi:hypothetical protein